MQDSCSKKKKNNFTRRGKKILNILFLKEKKCFLDRVLNKRLMHLERFQLERDLKWRHRRHADALLLMTCTTNDLLVHFNSHIVVNLQQALTVEPKF